MEEKGRDRKEDGLKPKKRGGRTHVSDLPGMLRDGGVRSMILHLTLPEQG